jgi:hypothetical protein
MVGDDLGAFGAAEVINYDKKGQFQITRGLQKALYLAGVP